MMMTVLLLAPPLLLCRCRVMVGEKTWIEKRIEKKSQLDSFEICMYCSVFTVFAFFSMHFLRLVRGLYCAADAYG
jgi:hypothetical protein